MIRTGAALVLVATPALAQHRAVEGMVINEHNEGIGGASIDVPGTFWVSISQTDGRFRIVLPAGEWNLRARRIGYAAATQRTVVRGDVGASGIRFVLAELPEALKGIVVTEERSAPFSSTITKENVRQIPALGEADIFRLLPMLPGVSQPNDLIGRVHLAGGASDEHAVRLDGHPLQAPFHVLSVLGAFNVAALERADVLIHHLPAETDGHLSGAINLETRTPKVRTTNEVVASILSASVTTSRPAAIWGANVLASGRLTYLDQILRTLVTEASASNETIAPGFRDALIKVDRQWSGGLSAEFLGYGTLDYWKRGHEEAGTRAPRWGEYLGGFRGRYARSKGDVRLRLSTNRSYVAYADSVDDFFSDLRLLDFVNLSQRWHSGALEGRLIGKSSRLSVGVAFDHRRHVHEWSGTKGDEWFTSQTPRRYRARSQQSSAGTFAEAALVLGSSWDAAFGTHVSFVEGASYVAPRLVFGKRLTPAVRLELAANRRHQFDAIAEEPLEGTTSQPVYFLSKPRIADVIAGSASWRPRARRRGLRVGVEAAAFARSYRDRTLLVPPDSLFTGESFPVFRRVPGHSRGASLTTDISSDRGFVLQGSYTAQAVRENVDGRLRPAAWDAPHNVSLFAALPVRGSWVATTALQLRSGTAVTPVEARILHPTGLGSFVPRFIYGDPNSARLPGYRRVDLGLRRVWRTGDKEWVLSAQVLNVFMRTNVLSYDWNAYFGCASRGICESDAAAKRRALPILPSIGMEVRW